MEGKALLQYIIDTSDVLLAKKQEATEYLASLYPHPAAQPPAEAGVCTCSIPGWDANSPDTCPTCGRKNPASNFFRKQEPRPCTCHPDDNPPVPCAKKYAYAECVASVRAAPVVVEFGAGEIGIMRTAEQGEDFTSGIAFVKQEPVLPIGKITPGFLGKTTDEVNAFLRFHFSNPDSAQVLIDDLIIIRDSLVSKELEP